jgi:hypothetical protein
MVSMEKPVKILLAGDVGGSLSALMKRVVAVNSKSGPFDMLICVGGFFTPGGKGRKRLTGQWPMVMGSTACCAANRSRPSSSRRASLQATSLTPSRQQTCSHTCQERPSLLYPRTLSARTVGTPPARRSAADERGTALQRGPSCHAPRGDTLNPTCNLAAGSPSIGHGMRLRRRNSNRCARSPACRSCAPHAAGQGSGAGMQAARAAGDACGIKYLGRAGVVGAAAARGRAGGRPLPEQAQQLRGSGGGFQCGQGSAGVGSGQADVRETREHSTSSRCTAAAAPSTPAGRAGRPQHCLP